jgi:CubicO group peptidase (beta-lactamase class C family)
VRHLLTMTAGLDWDEHTFSYSNPLDDIVRFYISRDPIGFVLSRRVSDVPGDVFNYCGSCADLSWETSSTGPAG